MELIEADKDMNKYCDKYKTIYIFEEFSAIYCEIDLNTRKIKLPQTLEKRVL